MLRHSIMTRPTSSSSPSTSPVSASPTKAGKELGVTVTSAELASILSPPAGKPPQTTVQPGSPYFPVPVDSSLRIGDNVGIEGASMDQLFEPSSPFKGQPPTTPPPTPFAEESFFGIEQQIRPASMCAQDPGEKSRWSPYPPFRFSVEFWDVDALKEKSRLHSRTIWYAGSLWNVYVQVVRKKGVQLGVYLHRQSTVDPIPSASAPVTFSSSSTSSLSRSQNLSHSSSGVPLHQTLSSPSFQSPTPSPSRSGTPHSLPSSPAMSSSLPSSYSPVPPSNHSAISVPATAPVSMPPQPWRDPRAAVSAYFTVACSGATGSSLTRFSSAPDVFSVSQSWGWKSSSLRTGEYSENDGDGLMRDTVAAGKDVSLRATVVLGVV